MIAMMKRAIRRFGGAELADRLPKDMKLAESMSARTSIDARLRAIEFDLDVQARKRLRLNGGG